LRALHALAAIPCPYPHGPWQIRDEQAVSHILKDYAIDTVMHLAAQTSVDHSFKDPAVFTEVNVVGTQRMLECCRKSPSLRLFLFCSTDEVCGEVENDAVTEDCPMKPTNPYSASKAAAELLVQGYSKSFQLPCIVTRCVNVYGGRQFPEKVIPKFIMRCSRGEPCCVHGDGRARRSFIYVKDVAEAFDLIMHKGKTGNIYNIGSHDCISVQDIADKVCGSFGEKGNIELVPDRLYNDCRSLRRPCPSPLLLFLAAALSARVANASCCSRERLSRLQSCALRSSQRAVHPAKQGALRTCGSSETHTKSAPEGPDTAASHHDTICVCACACMSVRACVLAYGRVAGGLRARSYALDCSKLEKLGWRQRTSFDEGLQHCLEWYAEDQGRSWEPEACEHALLPHSYIDGDGLTSGTRSLCAGDDELDDALRSAGVF
jgi:dTDP-glucose 4,6-dehydratase